MNRKLMCCKCGGFIKYDRIWCDKSSDFIDTWVCVNCGMVVDETIIKNKILSAIGEYPNKGKRISI